MMDQMISLSITAAPLEGDETFIFNVRLGDVVIASNQALTVEQSQRVRELSQQYGGLFEDHLAPKATEEALEAIGSELYSIWFAPYWKKLTARDSVGASRQMLIGSPDAEVLNLPWELLRPPGNDAIGTDGKWVLRRLPEAGGRLAPAPKKLPAGPLRVLYMVAAPTDQTDLDYEKEEELLLRSLSRAGQDVVFDSGDLGSFDELEQRIADFRPHLVHLTGHGIVQDGAGHFAFENEHGETDLRPASEIGQLFAGQGVQCAFISACQAGKAPNRNAQNGLAQGLLQQGVPLVIGWTASILDDVATELGARFYRDVANGRTSIDRALVAARQRARRLFAERSDPSWTLPVLYSATQQDHLFDPEHTEARMRSSLRLEALPGMSEEGFTPHFIGRRRELQQLLPALRTGDAQLVVLTGLGGAGKSTLATRLARKLEADGWTPIAMSSSDDVPLNAAALLETCGDAFLAAGLEDAHARLRSAALDMAERLRLLVNTLNAHRFVVVLDNFESNLDEGSRALLDPEISGFYKFLLSRLQGKSRVVITSRYLPSDAPLPGRAREWQLGEFGEAAFLKFMLRDDVIERRYREGELPHELLAQLHLTLGGTPRFLGQIRKLLERMSAEELEDELGKVTLPSAADGPRALQAARDAYCEKIFTARLYANLSSQAQQMVRRLAVLSLAVPIDGLAAIGGLTESEARAAADEASRMALLHYSPAQVPLWSVYGALRSWLLDPARMGDDERRLAHKSAGDYLKDIDEENRESELGISYISARQERRAQYIAAETWTEARSVTDLLSSFFIQRGLYSEVERLNREFLAHDDDAMTLFWIGSSFIERAEYNESKKWFEQSLKLSQRDKDINSQAKVLHQLASISLNEGDYAAARKVLKRSLKLRRQAEDKGGEITTLHQLASIDVHEGHYTKARKKFEEVLRMCRETGALLLESACLNQLGTIDFYEDEFVSARDKFNQALVINQKATDLNGESATLSQLAAIDIYERDFSAARDKLGRALAVKQQIGERAGEGAIWHQLATIELYEGDLPAAREKLARSLAIKKQIGDRAGEAATWHQFGVLADALEDYELALKLAALSWILHASIGHGQADAAYHNVISFATKLNYEQSQLENLVREVGTKFAEDHGLSLLQEIDAKFE